MPLAKIGQDVLVFRLGPLGRQFKHIAHQPERPFRRRSGRLPTEVERAKDYARRIRAQPGVKDAKRSV
jgi:hypothetical protein